MKNQKSVVEKAGVHLGKQINEYKTTYDPNLLVPVERELNRKDYNITNDDFVGYDVWHAYEVSFLTKKGLPTTAVAKIVVPSNSKYFFESKSLKLYLYSLNMERHGETREEGMRIIEEIVSKDLSEVTESKVKVKLFLKEDEIKTFTQYYPIEMFVNVNDIEFSVFEETPDLIETENDYDEKSIYLTNVRSNCRVTHQPDWATLYVHYKGKRLKLDSLLKYVVSFRNENHFHEEVCEQIFKILKTKIDPQELVVSMLYTRRGGIDICPVRATSHELLDQNLINVNVLTRKTINQ